MTVLRRFRSRPIRTMRRHMPALTRLAFAAVVMLGSLLPGSIRQQLPTVISKAIPDALTAALGPATAQAQVSGVSNFGSAVQCLTAPDQFATTCTTDTIFNKPADVNNPVAAPALVQFSKNSKAPKLAIGQIGATYGLAYDDGVASGKRRLFIGAFAQRFAAYGPGGAGAIYEYNLESGQVSTFAQLDNADRHGPRTNFDREMGLG